MTQVGVSGTMLRNLSGESVSAGLAVPVLNASSDHSIQIGANVLNVAGITHSSGLLCGDAKLCHGGLKSASRQTFEGPFPQLF